MKQSKKTQKIFGAQGFDFYYSQIFPNDWLELKTSLFSENVYLKLQFENCSPYFLDPASICAALTLPLDNLNFADFSSSDSDSSESFADSDKSAAENFATSSNAPQSEQKVLDMCAAPGGKTLVLSSNLRKNQTLFSNERSSSRKARLLKVCTESLPENLQKKLRISCSDASTWCRRETESYDAILLDAPCSSERHVLTDSKYLGTWSPSRIKSLAMEEWALLSCAWRLLKVNSYLLYSTCALNPCENDELISKLLKKFDNVSVKSFDECKKIFKNNLKTSKAKFSLPENSKFDFVDSNEISAQNLLERIYDNLQKTQYGFHILPHKNFSSGPIYFSLLQKTANFL